MDEEPATQVTYGSTVIAVMQWREGVCAVKECNRMCVCNVQAPDWNEELQAARDLPMSSLEERLLRDRSLLQVAQNQTGPELKQLQGGLRFTAPLSFLR